MGENILHVHFILKIKKYIKFVNIQLKMLILNKLLIQMVQVIDSQEEF